MFKARGESFSSICIHLKHKIIKFKRHNKLLGLGWTVEEDRRCFKGELYDLKIQIGQEEIL
ncbi:hypothetical protein BRL64_13505 [Bacillus safensis]|nr:hypothetical protein BRL64_13505 [Bacillus safensis]